jgi:6-pyruvoyl-tetrahydropterin synthase
MHGHSWQVELEWTYNELDQYGWGPNFADVKKIIDAFDHQNLNEMFDHASAEIVAQNIALRFSVMFRFAPDYVQIQEGSGNTVRWVPK